MNISDMILYSSFKHLSGFTAKKEIEYWKNGITNLGQLRDVVYSQRNLFEDRDGNDPITMSIQEISHGDLTNVFSELNRKSGQKDYFRIAYSFPEDVIFIDIETTGLSRIYHYVTVIGWVLNGQYNYWLPGMDEKPFIEALKKAKMIVTFNGIKFDCPFLNLTFTDCDIFEKPNLDLMYLCRSFGYTGGQKNIEKIFGFKRLEPLVAHDGKEAIVLWYKFLFGDESSLKELLMYNKYDIYGMMYILDYIFFRYIYGKTFPKVGSPLKFYSRKDIMSIKNDSVIANRTREYVNKNISNFDMLRLSSAKKYKIVGIDLAGVINKASKTGICILKDQTASTMVVKDNHEIVDYIINEKPDIVSIDAPLSLPYGRTTVYNDDPHREEIGIMRFSERELKRRGVNVYPALIDSMQELTKRGIELSDYIRKLGYPVIECFPGAAQDILQLPRKRTDETLLKTGLSRLGIHGDFEDRKVYHDELDAITAALVGQFFIAEYYEPIGIPEENDLIVPQTSKAVPKYNAVIGFAGPIATGKTTAANYLASKGYTYCRYSQIIAEKLAEQNILVNRQSMQKAGWGLFSSTHQYQLNEALNQRISACPSVVIDGLRHLEDYTFWKEKCFQRFFLIYIDSDYSKRTHRYKSLNPDLAYDIIIQHPAEAEVTNLKKLANIVISNSGSVQELYMAIDKAIEDITRALKAI